MKIILLIGSGGFLGSIARYGLQRLVHTFVPTAFPLGTLLINITGCSAIGLIHGFADKGGWLTEDWKAFLAIGLCGGFTTFSSFSYENIKLLQTGRAPEALLYMSASIIAGLIMTWAGITMSGK